MSEKNRISETGEYNGEGVGQEAQVIYNIAAEKRPDLKDKMAEIVAHIPGAWRTDNEIEPRETFEEAAERLIRKAEEDIKGGDR